MWASCDHRSRQHLRLQPQPQPQPTLTCTRAQITKVQAQPTTSFGAHVCTFTHTRGRTFAHSHTRHSPHNPQLAPRTCFCEDAGFRLYWRFFRQQRRTTSTRTPTSHAHCTPYHCVACALVFVSEFAFVLASGVLSSGVLLCPRVPVCEVALFIRTWTRAFFVALAVLVLFVPVHFLILLRALPLVLLYLLFHVHLFFVVGFVRACALVFVV